MFTTNPVVQMKEHFLHHLFFNNNIAAGMQKEKGPVLTSKKCAQIDGFFPHFTDCCYSFGSDNGCLKPMA